MMMVVVMCGGSRQQGVQVGRGLKAPDVRSTVCFGSRSQQLAEHLSPS